MGDWAMVDPCGCLGVCLPEDPGEFFAAAAGEDGLSSYNKDSVVPMAFVVSSERYQTQNGLISRTPNG